MNHANPNRWIPASNTPRLHFTVARLFAEELETRLGLRVDADCIFSSSHRGPPKSGFSSRRLSHSLSLLLKLEGHVNLRVETDRIVSDASSLWSPSA